MEVWASGRDGMVMEGTSPEEARKRFYVCSSVGLLGAPNGPYGDKNLKRDMQADRVPWLRKAQLTQPAGGIMCVVRQPHRMFDWHEGWCLVLLRH